MSRRFLILGGTGFLGKNLISFLKKKNYNKITSTYCTKSNFKKFKGVRYIKCDIANKKDIYKLGSNYNFVINFAGYVNHKNKNKTVKSHYIGCKNLADYFSNKKIELFIQIGSSLEYGNKKSPHRENLITNVNEMKSYYSKSKLMATKYLQKLSEKKFLNICIVRPYLIYGPGQEFNRLIPIVMKSAINNLNFDCSDGKQKRDFLYISDFIFLLNKIINKRGIKFEIFNAGSGKAFQIKKVVNKIINLVKRGKPNFGAIKSRPDESEIYYASNSKVKKILNWSPKVNLEKGLIRTFEFYKKNVR